MKKQLLATCKVDMKFIRAIVVGLYVLAVAAFVFAAGAPKAPAKPGQKAATKQQAVKPDSTPARPHIEWVRFDEGLQRAEAEKKNILIDFTATWCGWCKRMEAEAFADTAIINMVKKNYIPVRVYGDLDDTLNIKGFKISQKDLAVTQFNITGYPTFFFLCPEGIAYRRTIGYRDPQGFKDEMTNGLVVNCDSLKTVFDQMQKQQQQGQSAQPKSDG